MKRSLFKKLIGVCLAVAVAVGGVVVPEGNMVVAHAEERTYLYPADPGGNYCDYYGVYPRTYDNYADYLEAVAKRMPPADGYVGKTIAVSDLDDYSKSLGGAYESTNVNAYASVLCLLRRDTVPQRIEAYLIGYRSDGTKEIICKDDGYNIFGSNKDGIYEDGSDFQGYDSEGYGVDDGINREGLDRSGYTRSGIPVLTSALNKAGNIYYYNDEEVKPLSFKAGTSSEFNRSSDGSAVAFSNNNKGYYKVTLNGIKSAKIVGVYTEDKYKSYPVTFAGNGVANHGDVQIAWYPVKNGKVTFYTKAQSMYVSGEGIWSYKDKPMTGIEWVYLNSKEKATKESSVNVKITPVTKADIKKSSTVSASKTKCTVTSKTLSEFVSFTFNEPVRISGEYVCNCMIADWNTKTNKATLSWDKESKNSSVKTTVTVKGLYSGKTVKIKINKTK